MVFLAIRYRKNTFYSNSILKILKEMLPFTSKNFEYGTQRVYNKIFTTTIRPKWEPKLLIVHFEKAYKYI